MRRPGSEQAAKTRRSLRGVVKRRGQALLGAAVGRVSSGAAVWVRRWAALERVLLWVLVVAAAVVLVVVVAVAAVVLVLVLVSVVVQALLLVGSWRVALLRRASSEQRSAHSTCSNSDSTGSGTSSNGGKANPDSGATQS